MSLSRYFDSPIITRGRAANIYFTLHLNAHFKYIDSE
jgi:hypothetical protein